MRCRRFSFLITAVLLAGLIAAPAQGQSDDERTAAAKKAAAEWLDLMDANDYKASWEEAASLLTSQVTAEQWAVQVQQVHDQLGAFRERSLIAARYTTSLPNVPEGEYVIAQYRAQYENQTVIETATLAREEGTWRIAGYFVRPEGQ